MEEVLPASGTIVSPPSAAVLDKVLRWLNWTLNPLRQMIRNFRLPWLIVTVSLIGGCLVFTRPVSVPDYANDSPPKILLYNHTPNGGYVSQDVVSESTIVRADHGTEVMLWAKAESIRGVKDLVLNVSQGESTLQVVSVSQSLTTDGKAYSVLSIFGTNGNGEPGQQAIQVSIPYSFPGDPHKLRVSVTATNYNGMKSIVEEEFVTDCGCQPGFTSTETCACLCNPPQEMCGGVSCCRQGDKCCGDGTCVRIGQTCPGVRCPNFAPIECNGLCYPAFPAPCG